MQQLQLVIEIGHNYVWSDFHPVTGNI